MIGSDVGLPLEEHIREQLKNPEYRKHYMRYQVRVALAAVIRSVRELRGLTQTELARRVGVPQSQIARLEGVNDERIPSLELLVKIFAALDTHATLGIQPIEDSRAKQKEIVLA